MTSPRLAAAAASTRTEAEARAEIEAAKSPGQIAYEADLDAKPHYFDGRVRPEWHDLTPTARKSWEMNHTLHLRAATGDA